jgi:hypothetical protein
VQLPGRGWVLVLFALLLGVVAIATLVAIVMPIRRR